jgi:uncharacterized protein with NRDE domain
MCLIVFGYKKHPKFPLILLANRDEFYDRPTKPADYWEDAPQVFAGRDLVFGGTWLGITNSGKFAALTNFREPTRKVGTKSRGSLVSDFLTGDSLVNKYLEFVQSDAEKYSGFNLLVGDFEGNESEFAYYSNRGSREIAILKPGIYGLSNSLLDTPWQKVITAKKNLENEISNEFSENKLFEILQNRTLAADENLPETGIEIERERILSPIFIETPIYGTRCSSLVTFDSENGLQLTERDFH